MGSFSIDDGRRKQKRHYSNEFSFFQFFSRFFPNGWKCQKQANVPKLVSWGPYLSLEGEIKIHSRLFTSSIKRENRHFHFVVVQWQQIKVQKSMMYVQTCCFAWQIYCFYDVLVAAAVVVVKLPMTSCVAKKRCSSEFDCEIKHTYRVVIFVGFLNTGISSSLL